MYFLISAEPAEFHEITDCEECLLDDICEALDSDELEILDPKLFEDTGYVMVVDDSARSRGLLINKYASIVSGGDVCGDAIICKIVEDEESGDEILMSLDEDERDSVAVLLDSL